MCVYIQYSEMENNNCKLNVHNIPIDNPNTRDEKWNFAVGHLNLDDRNVTHFVKTDDNIHVDR